MYVYTMYYKIVLFYNSKSAKKLLNDNKLIKKHGPCVQQLDQVLNAGLVVSGVRSHAHAPSHAKIK